MDIFLTDPTDIPLPPNEVRVRKFEATPWSDGRRVRVYLELTPFQQRPDGEISITNSRGEELAGISFIETIDPKMEFTLHLSAAERGVPLTAHVVLFYRIMEEQGGEDQLPEVKERVIVDRSQVSFEFPPGDEA